MRIILIALLFVNGAYGQDTSLADFAELIVKRIKSIPNCEISYKRIESVSSDNLKPSLQDSASGSQIPQKLQQIHQDLKFCKYENSFFVKVFEHDQLSVEVSYDGTNYYYYQVTPGQKKLWIGSSNGVIDSALSTLLLNSPLFMQFRGIPLWSRSHFYYPYIESPRLWVDALASLRVLSADANQVTFSKSLGDTVYEICYDKHTLFPIVRIRSGGELTAEMKIVKAFEPKGLGGKSLGLSIPSRYFEGSLDDVGLPKKASALTTVDETSFHILSSPPKEGFAIPRAMADRLVDTDLGVPLRR